MKKYIVKIATGILFISLTVSCFDLSETPYSQIPLEGYFQTEEDVVSYAGRAYIKLQPYPEEQRLWSLGENASDELVIPAKHNGEWYDQGRWEDIHKHKVAANNKILTSAWTMVFEGVTACNEILETLAPIDFSAKDRILSEIKILRAFYYYWGLDYWGNIPYSITYSDKTAPPQKNRKFIYDFILQEITDNIDNLQDQPTSEYYGRVTKGMAYTLLAKMYLNAEEWVGEDRYQEAIDACDQVIALGAYAIADDYFSNFAVHNEGSQENIFVIPYHPQLTDEHFYWENLTLNAASRPTFNIIGIPWDGFVLPPDFFTKYAANDERIHSFLFGQQYDIDGNPIMIEGEPFIYTPTIDNYSSRGEYEGARCAKYEYQENLNYDVTDMENDFVLFRYADVLYMKLEALWRLERADEFINDPSLQKIRTRAGLTAYAETDLTAQELLDEFGREFAWEGRRRQDQIRFGVWGNTWWNKPVSDATKKLFPIPQSAIIANPNLIQNP